MQFTLSFHVLTAKVRFSQIPCKANPYGAMQKSVCGFSNACSERFSYLVLTVLWKHLFQLGRECVLLLIRYNFL